jgi:uncharacterized integral membrane protein
MNYKLIVALVLAAFGVIFIFQNIAVAQIQFLFWSFTISQSLLIILLLALGIAIGWLLQGYLRRRQRRPDSDS